MDSTPNCRHWPAHWSPDCSVASAWAKEIKWHATSLLCFVAIRFDFWIQGNRNVQTALQCGIQGIPCKVGRHKTQLWPLLVFFFTRFMRIGDLFLFNLHCRGRKCPGLHWSRLAPRDIPLLRSSCTRLKILLWGMQWWQSNQWLGGLLLRLSPSCKFQRWKRNHCNYYKYCFQKSRDDVTRIPLVAH